jgi:hypothetical protein
MHGIKNDTEGTEKNSTEYTEQNGGGWGGIDTADYMSRMSERDKHRGQ